MDVKNLPGTGIVDTWHDRRSSSRLLRFMDTKLKGVQL